MMNEYTKRAMMAEKKAEMLEAMYEKYCHNAMYDSFDKQTGIILKNIERFKDEIVRNLSEDDAQAIINWYLFTYEWDLNH